MHPRVRGENLSIWRPTRHSLELRFLRFLDEHESFASLVTAIFRPSEHA